MIIILSANHISDAKMWETNSPHINPQSKAPMKSNKNRYDIRNEFIKNVLLSHI